MSAAPPATPASTRPAAIGAVLGSRSSAAALRSNVLAELSRGGQVVLDFTGLRATQGYVDELIGQIVLDEGPAALKRIALRNCCDELQAIVRFVVQDRASQYRSRQQGLLATANENGPPRAR